jgi:glutathione synthase
MRIAFVVNNIETEQDVYSTTRLAMTAVNMGHEVWILSVSDFVYDPDGSILAHARSTPANKTSYRSLKSFLADIQKKDARSERISVDDIDILLLRTAVQISV